MFWRFCKMEWEKDYYRLSREEFVEKHGLVFPDGITYEQAVEQVKELNRKTPNWSKRYKWLWKKRWKWVLEWYGYTYTETTGTDNNCSYIFFNSTSSTDVQYINTRNDETYST